MNVAKYVLLVVLLISNTSCKTLLPGGEDRGISRWQSYQQAETTFDQIIPNVTTSDDLKLLGIDFKTTPGLKKLTYLDVMERFNLNSSVFSDIKLPKGIQEALNKHHNCVGYELTLKTHYNKRIGSFWKDTLGFQQVTKTHGWEFTGLIIIADNIVVYVLTSGAPRIENIKSEKKPLGPFQNIDGSDILGVAEGL